MDVGTRYEDIKSMKRKMVVVAGHLISRQARNRNDDCDRISMTFKNCSTRMDDTYHRVHGQVPTHIPHWTPALDNPANPFSDIIYEKAEVIAKITINMPEKRNAFRPQTVKVLIRAFNDARDYNSIGVVILTGKGTKAFCSGGDQSFTGKEGYADYDNFRRLNVLDLPVQIRRLPKPVIAMASVSITDVFWGGVMHQLLLHVVMQLKHLSTNNK